MIRAEAEGTTSICQEILDVNLPSLTSNDQYFYISPQRPWAKRLRLLHMLKTHS
jgi:hypothetical protein